MVCCYVLVLSLYIRNKTLFYNSIAYQIVKQLYAEGSQ